MTKITAANKANLKWYQQPIWAAVMVPLCLLGCYVMASLALNSASLVEYFIAIVLLVLAINRTAHLFLISVSKFCVTKLRPI
jgi:hypothetical protein